MDQERPEDRQEDEPDVRFSFANERTFLAWNRTALALIATGIAATQLLPQFHIERGTQDSGHPPHRAGCLRRRRQLVALARQ